MRYLGLTFYKDDDSGIAKINVTDTVTGAKLLDDKLVDLFQKDQDATYGYYEEFILWVTLPYDNADRYQWTVEHSGSNNASAVGPNYAINFMGYTLTQNLIKAHTVPKVVLVDKVNTVEYPFEFQGTIAEYTYELLKEETKKLYITTQFLGDGESTSFKVGNENLINYNFIRFSIDRGTTWKYPWDLSITWGSNSPDYDDELINSSGEFWVNFLEAPAENTSIYLESIPVFDTVRVEMTLNQPSDEEGYIDYNTPFAVQEYAIEFKI